MQTLVNAIIDAELDAARLAKEAYDSASTTAKRLQNMARNMVALAAKNKLNKDQAKKIWLDAFKQLVLIQYAKQLPEIRQVMGAHMDAQQAAAKKLGASIRKVPAIRNVHIKQRAMERAGALDASGVVDDGN